MSLIVAIKKDDAIYIGADTLITQGTSQLLFGTNHNNSKIKLFDNGIIVGNVGGLSASHNLINLSLDEKISKDTRLTKEIIAKHIVNPLILDTKSRNNGQKQDNGVLNLDMSLIIAKDDELFLMNHEGGVYICESYATIGSGRNEAYPFLVSIKSESPQGKLLKALSFVSKLNIGVGAPFMIADTKSNHISFYEEITI